MKGFLFMSSIKERMIRVVLDLSDEKLNDLYEKITGKSNEKEQDGEVDLFAKMESIRGIVNIDMDYDEALDDARNAKYKKTTKDEIWENIFAMCGTVPFDIDEKKELQEARDEKFENFN